MFCYINKKIGKVVAMTGDIGQIQMYGNYYDRVIKIDDENFTVGILLSTDKNKIVVKYTLLKNNKKIFYFIISTYAY